MHMLPMSVNSFGVKNVTSIESTQALGLSYLLVLESRKSIETIMSYA